MRKILYALLVLITLGVSDDTKIVKEVNNDALTDSLINELKEYGMTMMEQEDVIQVAQSQCMGYATCWGRFGSYQVTCYSYGAGCTWETFPGRGVRCTSMDMWGNYFYSWGRC